MRIQVNRLTRGNASEVKASVTAAAAAGDAVLDFSAVITVDSSAVAVVLAWIRILQVQGVRPMLVAVPDKLVSLMRLYGVYGLLEEFFEKGASVS